MKRSILAWLGAAVALACGSDTVTGPNLPAAPTAATALALGAQFSCALTSAAKPFCWGDGLSGEIGDSTFVSKLVPTSVAGGRAFVAMAAGVLTACGLTHEGSTYCWGDDPTQPGVAVSLKNAPVLIQVPPLSAVGVGRKFACGLDASGSAYCWGENGRGQLGAGDTLKHASPTRVIGGLHFKSIAVGFWHACALESDGAAYCWGDNQYGEAGVGDTLAVWSPKKVSGTTAFQSLGAGSIHQCAVTRTGGAMCWGANFSGQLGDGTATRRLVPTAAAQGLTFKSLHGGRANSIFGHTCGITNVGDVYCWGWNSKGQAGTGASTDPCMAASALNLCSYTPVRLAGMSSVAALEVGLEHTCALTAGGLLYCWGENAHGELGDGTGVAQRLPVLVKGGLAFPAQSFAPD